MHSIRQLFRIGPGPSSSHTMGPHRAVRMFAHRHADATSWKITLYGALAATARGHLTDRTIISTLSPAEVSILMKPEIVLSAHPNAMDMEALDASGKTLGTWRVYSTGGGAISDDRGPLDEGKTVYGFNTMDQVLDHCGKSGQDLPSVIMSAEDDDFPDFLDLVWETMQKTIARGLENTSVLPGDLHLSRKARSYYRKAGRLARHLQRAGFLSAYALASAEENAAGHTVVTAPTCGSCGVLPAVLHYLQENLECSVIDIRNALATAGLIGNFVKHNASISGAQVGCQGEIGTACAMAAAAAAQLLGATPLQVEYAAEMGLEHHLGLTCDPVGGYVQIPCIERNAMAATRAMDCAEYSLLSDGRHYVSFDQVTETMKHTGLDMPSPYRETSVGGLARTLMKNRKNSRQS